MKYLLWALLIYLAWRWFSAAQARKRSQVGDAAVSKEPAPGAGTERMVKCAGCGLHLPLSEALPGPGDRFFCSDAHRHNATGS